jgi:glycosyltransferase involved in cell wall biosynthesis
VRTESQKLSVVIPLYNEEETLPELHRRLTDVLGRLDLGYEIVFVNDGSADRTADMVRALARDDARIKFINLSRNFGHRPALAAGIAHATGDVAVLMDGDLQDKPEAIPDFLAKWREGYDVVYAVRYARKEGFFSRIAFKAFYWLLAGMSGIKQPLDAGIFSLLDRRALNVLRSLGEHNRYYPGLRAFIGFKQVGVPTERDARHAGTSRVRLSGLIRLACDAIFSFSFVPIRAATYLGLLVAAGAFIYLMVILYFRLFTDEAVTGWASTLVSILFLGAVQLITLGILGEYIGRIYEETKKRPYFIVAETINIDDQSP